MRPAYNIILLSVVFVMLLVTAWAFYKQPYTSTKIISDKEASAQSSGESQTSWYMFRGEPSLRGFATGRLSDSLKLLWKFKTEAPTRSSPTVKDGRVFVGSDDGKIYCLNLSDGQEIWSFETEDSIEAAPCILDDSVYVGSSDSFLYALDAESGKLKWKYETGAKILGAANWSPSPKDDGFWILVGSYDNMLHCVDSKGQAVWIHETCNYINGAPAISDGRAVFGGCDEIAHVVSIDDNKSVAEVETGSYIASSPALVGDRAYVGNYGGDLYSIDIVKGEIVWNYKSDDSPFFSSPAVGEDQVVIGARDKRLHCVSRDKGKLIWTFEARGNIDSSPVICDGKVIAGSDDGRLYMVKLSDGKMIWSYEIGEALTASPAVVNGMVIISSEDGYVYAFGSR
jgi:outer membrane protein assembly factor BamB